MKRIILAFFVLLVAATSAVYGSQDFVGVLNDAPYKIRVPDMDKWNGVLLLYAHYYYTDPASYAQANAAHGGAPMEEFLLAQGYALAGSSFRGSGWQVKEGTFDLIALSGLFNDLVGKPKKRILMGFSMGSLIALKSAEEVPLYDGVLAMSFLGGLKSGVGERDGSFGYAYATVFGWPASWGTWYDVRDDLSFSNDVLPVFGYQLNLLLQGDVETYAKFEFIRLLLKLPHEGFYAADPPQIPAVYFLMIASTEAKAEIERRANGPTSENADHVYSLTQAEKNYLLSLGFDADWVLESMNAGTTILAAKPQRQYCEKYFDPTGDLRIPVLSVHSIKDHLYPAHFETRLLNKVQAAGREDRFLQVYTDGFGHVYFTPEQLLAAIKAMESWLNSGTMPDPDDPSVFPQIFPNGSKGFVVPAPELLVWPIGKK